MHVARRLDYLRILFLRVLIDVFARDPELEPAAGAERFEWDPSAHAWHSV